MKLFETKLAKEDILKITDVLSEGSLGFGSNVDLFEQKFSSFSNKKNNIATNSASASAFMIFSYLKEKYGICDVYTTSLGFTSPAWAAKQFGHNLIFVDVQDDLQFSTEHYKSIRNRYSSSTNKPVVMPVLYGGVSNIDGFELFGDEITVIDSAHCVTPTIEGDYIFFSFHPYKPICSSDGGMISTDCDEASEYFRSYRNFGRVMIDNTYDVNQNGFKFYMNNLNATIALTQLDRYEENLSLRRSNYKNLSNSFNLLPHDANSSFYFATCLKDDANDVIIKTGWSRHYPMLHKMSYYDTNQTLPNLEKLHSKILNLPLWKKIDR